MVNIAVLDSQTIDKIAAGEVVERPASVVKELVENAMDAGATAITVEIKEGGIGFIRVTDNGIGIPAEQVKKAFLRHATSKIKTVEDLMTVSSLGFRGEALSSIAAVGQVELITKTENELIGILYRIEGAVEKKIEEIGAPIGTTFIVRNLFFNTPVRRKFLKSASTEGSYITELMEHMAMSNPLISFKYIQNGQPKLQTSGKGILKDIIYHIYGRDIATQLLVVEAKNEFASIHGFIGLPAISRGNRTFENYYVNGRYMKSNIIAKAIEEAYKTFLMQHKYPFTALHFTIDSKLLDVNVHPTKMELRFSNQEALYQFIVNSIKETLSNHELIPTVSFMEVKKGEKEPITEVIPEPFERGRMAKVISEENKRTVNEAIAIEKAKNIFNAKGEETKKHIAFAMRTPKKEIVYNRATDNSAVVKESAVYGEMVTESESGNNIIKAKDHIIVEKPSQLEFFEQGFLTKEAKEDYRIIGQIFKTYWFVELKDKLFMIDQHAAHEKVLYERMKRTMLSNSNKMNSQIISPPIIVTLTGVEEKLLLEYMEHFKEVGFEIEHFGGNEYAVSALPEELYGMQGKELFQELVDLLKDELGVKDSLNINDKIASMACKAAVKGNNKMTDAEVEALIEELLELENPYYCPHGRPTIVAMTKYELEKKFKRTL